MSKWYGLELSVPVDPSSIAAVTTWLRTAAHFSPEGVAGVAVEYLKLAESKGAGEWRVDLACTVDEETLRSMRDELEALSEGGAPGPSWWEEPETAVFTLGDTRASVRVFETSPPPLP